MHTCGNSFLYSRDVWATWGRPHTCITILNHRTDDWTAGNVYVKLLIGSSDMIKREKTLWTFNDNFFYLFLYYLEITSPFCSWWFYLTSFCWCLSPVNSLALISLAPICSSSNQLAACPLFLVYAVQQPWPVANIVRLSLSIDQNIHIKGISINSAQMSTWTPSSNDLILIVKGQGNRDLMLLLVISHNSRIPNPLRQDFTHMLRIK